MAEQEREFILTSDIFSKLNNIQKAAIWKTAKRITFENEFIIDYGAENTDFFIILQGTVHIYSLDQQGQQLAYKGSLSPGYSFGEHAALSSQPSTFTACTEESVILYQFKAQTLASIVPKPLSILGPLTEELFADEEIADEEIADIDNSQSVPNDEVSALSDEISSIPQSPQPEVPKRQENVASLQKNSTASQPNSTTRTQTPVQPRSTSTVSRDTPNSRNKSNTKQGNNFSARSLNDQSSRRETPNKQKNYFYDSTYDNDNNSVDEQAIFANPQGPFGSLVREISRLKDEKVNLQRLIDELNNETSEQQRKIKELHKNLGTQKTTDYDYSSPEIQNKIHYLREQITEQKTLLSRIEISIQKTEETIRIRENKVQELEESRIKLQKEYEHISDSYSLQSDTCQNQLALFEEQCYAKVRQLNNFLTAKTLEAINKNLELKDLSWAFVQLQANKEEVNAEIDAIVRFRHEKWDPSWLRNAIIKMCLYLFFLALCYLFSVRNSPCGFHFF